jgi:Fe-S cluster assembly protein SufD
MNRYEINSQGLASLGAKSADWLKADRQNGFELFGQLPFPQRTDESWRRTNPKLVALEGKQVVAGSSQFGALGEAAMPTGITFGPAETLLTENALELAKRQRDSGRSIFSALNEAFWQGGTVLDVGKNVSTGEQALHAQHHFEGGENSLALPRSIVRVDKFSKVTLIETFTSGEDTMMAAPLADIYLGEGASLKYVIVQKWGSETTTVPTVRAHIEKDAHLQVLYVGLGGKLTKLFGECDLEGEGCKSEVLGLVMAAEKQHFDFDVNQYHRLGANVSDVLFHIALADEARTVFSGNVVCGPGAQKIDGYQQNRNLLLSSKARADSMPKLEIEANDVRCTHGATFTTFDAGQNFYLRSRGLNEAEAKRLLVRGFFQEVVNRVEQDVVVEHLMDLVAEKMDQTLGR